MHLMETTYIGATVNELHTIELNCHIYICQVSWYAWYAFLTNVTAMCHMQRSFHTTWSGPFQGEPEMMLECEYLPSRCADKSGCLQRVTRSGQFCCMFNAQLITLLL